MKDAPPCQMCSLQTKQIVHMEKHTSYTVSLKPYKAWKCPRCQGVWAR